MRHGIEQHAMGCVVGCRDQPETTAVRRELAAAQVRHDAAGCPADRHACGKVHVVGEEPVADVRRAPSGRHPGERERGRQDARGESALMKAPTSTSIKQYRPGLTAYTTPVVTAAFPLPAAKIRF